LLVRLKSGFTLNRREGHWHLEPRLSSTKPDAIEGLVPTDFVEYAKKGSNWAHSIPVGRDGTLRVVYELTNSLAKRFRWLPAQATMFLFTEAIPLVDSSTIAIEPPPHVLVPWGGLLPLECLTRVTLTIDPRMTPEEMAKVYAKARAKMLVEEKPRSQSEKHLRLAVFAVKHLALDRDAMREWGRTFPNWKYESLALFARDARVAIDRLVQGRVVDAWKAVVDPR
jgi:hypothetical protein